MPSSGKGKQEKKGLRRPGTFQFRLGKALLPGPQGAAGSAGHRLLQGAKHQLSMHHSRGDVGSLQSHPCLKERETEAPGRAAGCCSWQGRP